MAEGTSVCWERDRLASPALVVLVSGEEKWCGKTMGASQAWSAVASQTGAAQPVETGRHRAPRHKGHLASLQRVVSHTASSIPGSGSSLLTTRPAGTTLSDTGKLRLGILSWSLKAPQCYQSGSVQRNRNIRNKCGPLSGRGLPMMAQWLRGFCLPHLTGVGTETLRWNLKVSRATSSWALRVTWPFHYLQGYHVITGQVPDSRPASVLDWRPQV